MQRHSWIITGSPFVDKEYKPIITDNFKTLNENNFSKVLSKGSK